MKASEWIRYFFSAVLLPRSTRTMEWRMLRLLNVDRKRHKLAALRMQDDLRQVARKHSRDMAGNDYFDHTNRSFQSPADRLRSARVSDVHSGENLARILGYKNPTQRAEKGLMESPGHRANILNDRYNCVGIGVVQSKDRTYYFTQNFAHRRVILEKRIPEKVSIKGGLRLKGQTFGKVSSLYFQVLRPGSEMILKEGFIPLQKRKFDYRIGFDEVGRFSVRIFFQEPGSKAHSLSNTLEITVYRGLFGLW